MSPDELRPATVTRLLLALSLVAAPHVVHLPLWLSIVAVVLGLWRWLVARTARPLPGTLLRVVLTSVVLLAVYSRYGTLFGREAGVSLLIAMLALKLLELKTPRDVYVAVFLGYFLIVTNFLYSQSAFLAAYMFLVVMALTALLIDLNRHQPATVGEDLRVAGRLVVLAVPLMIALFMLFPRVAGPLWGLPKDAHGGLSGLSDEMTPGRISQLGQSNAIVFRASFDGPFPQPQQRYWRGPVLWQTDGERWQAGTATEHRSPLTGLNYETLSEPLQYSIILEPHNRLWLYALDLPASVPPQARLTADFQLHATRPVRERWLYSVASHPDYRTPPLSDEERKRALQLPPEGSPRARAMASRWRLESPNDVAIVQRALQRFRNEPFVYTLQPPLTENDFVDEFIFTTRRGFCGHYAASFVFLMRAAGVPARVVTGYQGGEVNPVGNYLIVRQRDAHAWAEVWLPGQGWTRIDPTAAVAPERVEMSIDTSALGEQVRFHMPNQAWLRQSWQTLSYGWDTFNNAWNQWVLAYGPDRQASLLSWLQGSALPWQVLATLLLAAVFALLLTLILLWLHRERRDSDAATRLYSRYCRKLAHRGLGRAPHEGPTAYAKRVALARPDLALASAQISRLYSALRYAPYPAPVWLARLRYAVRHFRP